MSDPGESPNAQRPAIWSATPDEVRSRFRDFFRARGHEVLPSASLVPENDPSLLFIGAGMAPFKDHFLGRVPLKFRRAATSQKCLRTGDLENVGRTPGHHTFFEMLGNFSFGDYFKKEAVEWAWEFLTVEMAIPKDRLRVTVYRDDHEAAGHWTRIAGIPADRIGRLGAKSNFWPANAPEDGPDGPCGPCSEIFFDLGFKPDPTVACTVKGCPEAPESPDCDCRRFLEVWNLVFQQFERKGRNNLVPLAMQNIDTGMGFERLLTVLAHLREPKRRITSNFETQLFVPLVNAILGIPAQRSATSPDDHVRARRIADHVRAALFCLCDGVNPSNEGRGYVLRRVIRRAVRDGIQLGIGAPFLHDCHRPLRDLMGKAYPDLAQEGYEIRSRIRAEEDRFRQTFAQGVARLQEMLPGPGAEQFSLSGDQAFLLHDTYGFPVDVTLDILRENGFELDRAGFDAAMEKARHRSREGSKMATEIFAAGPLERVKRQLPGTFFYGYGIEPERSDGTYEWQSGIALDEAWVAEILVSNQPVDRMEPGQKGAVILRGTPFYAEQGGQVGDTGAIRGPDGAVFRVHDTQKVETFHLHLGRLEGGALSVGDKVSAEVDRDRRDAVRRNHTGTHLLHRVLQEVLGADARQAGSLVAPDYLRFDFTWPRAVTPEERERIEAEVNRRIRDNQAVKTRVYTIEEARATGAVSMFGEKYGSRVRVLTAGDSMEFCGGTHCRATGDIQEFRIVSEKSIGSGVRRIEAVTGTEAVAAFERERKAAAAREEEERRRREEAKAAKKAAETGTAAAPSREVDFRIGRFAFEVKCFRNAPDKRLLECADRIKGAAGEPMVGLLVSEGPDDIKLVVVGNSAAIQAGFNAGTTASDVAKRLGGGGGGRIDLARGKGKDPARLREAEDSVREYLKSL